MDASARLSVVLALTHSLPHHSCTDLYISAFAAAVSSSRRATVCKPFPSHIFGPDGHQAAAAAVQGLPPVTTPEQLHDASDEQLRLLQWLLLQLSRTWVVAPCTAEQLTAELLASNCSGHTGLQTALQQACCVFRLAPSACRQHNSLNGTSAPPPGGQRRIIAFHGTDAASVHSILHMGLLSASGTRLQTTGAVFGQGIYLSRDFNTAFSFTKGRQAWQHSMLGCYLRCVLVCDLASEATVCQGDASQPGSASSLPHTYIVAPRPSDVTLRYLLVFSDDHMLGHTSHAASRRFSSSSSGCSSAGGGGSGRVSTSGRVPPRPAAASTCWALTCAYLALMVVWWLWKSTANRSKW